MNRKYYDCYTKCIACSKWFETKVNLNSEFKNTCCSKKCKFWIKSNILNCSSKCKQCNKWFLNKIDIRNNEIYHNFCSRKCTSLYHSKGEKNGMYGKGYKLLGEKNGMYGKGYKLLGEKNGRYNKEVSQSTRDKISYKNSGSKHVFYGTKRSEETKEKMRKARLNKVTPNYNKNSIQIIEKYGKENNYNFQHAENGGEIRISGYSIDAYDKDKNIVLEYYERQHKKQKEKDEKRKNQIIKKLNCKFIIIWYDGVKEIFN